MQITEVSDQPDFCVDFFLLGTLGFFLGGENPCLVSCFYGLNVPLVEPVTSSHTVHLTIKIYTQGPE